MKHIFSSVLLLASISLMLIVSPPSAHAQCLCSSVTCPFDSGGDDCGCGCRYQDQEFFIKIPRGQEAECCEQMLQFMGRTTEKPVRGLHLSIVERYGTHGSRFITFPDSPKEKWETYLRVTLPDGSEVLSYLPAASSYDKAQVVSIHTQGKVIQFWIKEDKSLKNKNAIEKSPEEITIGVDILS